MVSLKSSPWVKYTHYGTVFQKNFMFYYQTFFLLQICSLLDCSSQIPEKKSGVTVLVGENRSIYFAIGFNLSEISYVLYAHVVMCAR